MFEARALALFLTLVPRIDGDGRIALQDGRYRDALEIQPALIPAQQGLGSLLLERGEPLTAIELFRDSVALRPGDPVLRKNLALALHRAGRLEEAEAELQKARELERLP